MISLSDLVTLAKAGWTPKATKEVLEMLETSPKIQEAAPEDLTKVEIKSEEVPPTTPTAVEQEADDAIETLKKLLQD